MTFIGMPGVVGVASGCFMNSLLKVGVDGEVVSDSKSWM